jgi:GntR family transcriptional regulator
MNKLELDRGGPVPLHRQIEGWLRRLIREPAYRDGKPLPDEVTLAGDLGVSRNTLRAALSPLIYEGLLSRTPRVGTRVVRQSVETSLAAWGSFTEEMRRKGIEVQNLEVALSRVKAGPEEAGGLGVGRGAWVWRLRRLRGWGGRPAVLAISWLHPRLGIRGGEDFDRPLYEVLRKASGAVAAVSREEITAVAAGADLGRALRIPAGTPALLRTRTILDSRGRPMEFNRNYYRVDRYALTLELRRASREA